MIPNYQNKKKRCHRPRIEATEAFKSGAVPSQMSAAEFNAMIVPGFQVPKKNKFNARKTVVDGIRFDSKKESDRYLKLKMLEKYGQIEGLEWQVDYPIIVNGKNCGKYIADFRYKKQGKEIIEDVKSEATRTSTYRLKKKLVEAIYGIIITES